MSSLHHSSLWSLPRLAAAAVVALLLVAVQLGRAAAISSCAKPFDPGHLDKTCQALSKVCLDQSNYVLYDNTHNPRHPQYKGKPSIDLTSTRADYYGFGDAWNTAIPYPQPLMRPATAGEETKELRRPQFSHCTVPLVLYPDRVYMHSEFYMRTLVTLHGMQVKGQLDRRVTLVVATLGMDLAPFHSFMLGPFSVHPATTLSQLSSRLPLETPETYNPDGQHVRCFRQVVVCQMTNFNKLGLEAPLWNTAQAVLDHYRAQLPVLDATLYPGFVNPKKLRVIIVARERRAHSPRQLLNQEQVHSWCLKFQPPPAVLEKLSRPWNGTSCALHDFGEDPLLDLALASQADVMVGLHASALLNAFYMPKGSSVVEVRPYQYVGVEPNMYMKDMTGKEDGHSIFWWGINVATADSSRPSPLELAKRGDPSRWPRDRHTMLRLVPLQYLLERILVVQKDRSSYLELRNRKQAYITDTVLNLDDKQR